MSATSPLRPVLPPDIRARKGQAPLVALTAYTTPMARLVDAHCDIALVGDSLGMVLHGLPSTLGVTLDMMILKAVSRGDMHGYAIAQFIQQASRDVLRVEEGALYPALHRLEVRGLLTASWGTSDNNRRAKYYRLTAAGRRELDEEALYWRRVASAVTRVMATT